MQSQKFVIQSWSVHGRSEKTYKYYSSLIQEIFQHFKRQGIRQKRSVLNYIYLQFQSV